MKFLALAKAKVSVVYKTTMEESGKLLVLPDIVLLNVLQYLNPQDLLALCDVDEKFQELCTSRTISE